MTTGLLGCVPNLNNTAVTILAWCMNTCQHLHFLRISSSRWNHKANECDILKGVDMYHHRNFWKDTTSPLIFPSRVRAEVLKGLELECRTVVPSLLLSPSLEG